MICYIKALLYWFSSGIFIPHVYEEIERRKTIVISTDTSFRESDSLEHLPYETVHRNSTVILNKCKHCGKLDLEWFEGNEEDIMRI
jgi:uncharacterized membrane-anchored protein